MKRNNWLVLSVIAVITGCCINEEINLNPTNTIEVTTLPSSTPIATYDPYILELRHSPLETLVHLKNLEYLEKNKYYGRNESPGKNLEIITVYDFNNGTEETRVYTFSEGEEITPESINSKNFLLVVKIDYISSIVNTYKDDLTHISNANCTLNYKTNEFYPKSEACDVEYFCNKHIRVKFIVDAIMSTRLGDSEEDIKRLETSLNNDPELQNNYINLILDYFKE